MNRFLTWQLIFVLGWCAYALHNVSAAITGPWYMVAVLFFYGVAVPVSLGAWYGLSIRQEVK